MCRLPAGAGRPWWPPARDTSSWTTSPSRFSAIQPTMTSSAPGAPGRRPSWPSTRAASTRPWKACPTTSPSPCTSAAGTVKDCGPPPGATTPWPRSSSTRSTSRATFLEYDTPRAGTFEPLRFLPAGKVVALGLVSTKGPTLESADHLKRRIDDASPSRPPWNASPLPPNAVSPAPSRVTPSPKSDQEAKLARIVEVADDGVDRRLTPRCTNRPLRRCDKPAMTRCRRAGFKLGRAAFVLRSGINREIHTRNNQHIDKTAHRPQARHQPRPNGFPGSAVSVIALILLYADC